MGFFVFTWIEQTEKRVSMVELNLKSSGRKLVGDLGLQDLEQVQIMEGFTSLAEDLIRPRHSTV